MKKMEQVKIFAGGEPSKVEKAYNKWYAELQTFRESVPALKGQPPVIHNRELTVRQYKGEETIAIAVFYEHIHLEAHEQGPDRGQAGGGYSMIPGEGQKRR